MKNTKPLKPEATFKSEATFKPQATFKLTNHNYFSPERPHISSTQMKTYLRSKDLYYKRYVKHDPSVQFVAGDSVKRGSIVDALLTGTKHPYQVRVLARDDKELYDTQKTMPPEYLVSQKLMDQALFIAEEVKKHPLWSEGLAGAEFQRLLSGVQRVDCGKVTSSVPVCGLIDRLDPQEDGTYRLIDLKVTNASAIRSVRTWFWQCHDFRYDIQMALYRDLLAKQLGISVNKIRCYHVVTALVEPGLVAVKGFEFSEELLMRGRLSYQEALKGIASKDFSDSKTTWQDIEVLGEEEVFEAVADEEGWIDASQ